uniref:Uncharacterized protein n=1 Tax=Roseihalotalea indica TaxID=2867963 RepID=A0AA49GPE7_9BACT|nr:hypothetical protein K4G66_07705 [Tunicatimonas sp. TK19036]
MKHPDIRTDEDLVVGNTNYDPEGNLVYDPVIGRLALWTGIGTALAVGLISYLIATGLWLIPSFGQFAAAGPTVAVFTGGSVGLATGGLTGALIGLSKMVKKNKEKHPGNPQEREYA